MNTTNILAQKTNQDITHNPAYVFYLIWLQSAIIVTTHTFSFLNLVLKRQAVNVTKKNTFHCVSPEKVLGEHEPIEVIVISEGECGARPGAGGAGRPS